jgi:amino acid adenylation domain-containing protein
MKSGSNYVENFYIYKRKISCSEQFHLAMVAASIPLRNQLVIEFQGDLNFTCIQKAIEIASELNPGSRLFLKGRLKRATWVDSGNCAKLIKVDSPWNAENSDCNQYIERPLDERKGPTTEVILFNNATLLFRVHHAVMDGKGMVTWVEDIFSALRGELPKGADCRFTDREQALLLGAKEFRPNYAANVESPLGLADEGISGIKSAQKRILGVYPGLVARIAETLADQIECSENEGKRTLARFIIPVDMRRHRPKIRTTANMISGLIINLFEKTLWKDIQQSIITKLQLNEEGMVGQWDNIFHYLPTKATASLIKHIIHVQEREKRFIFTATISNMGKIDLEDFSCQEFNAKKLSFIPVVDPLSAVTIVTAEFEDHVDVTLSSQRSYTTNQRQEKLLELIESGLKESALNQKNEAEVIDNSIKSVTVSSNINFLLSRPICLNQKIKTNSPAEQQTSITPKDFQVLKLMCDQRNMSLEAALSLAWHKLLQLYTKEEQTIIGFAVSIENKLSNAFEKNEYIFPLKVDWKGNKTVSELLLVTKKGLSELNYDNSIRSDNECLFHSLLINEGGEGSSDTATLIEKVGIPLLITVFSTKRELTIKLHYGEEWLDKKQSKRLLAQLKLILTSFAMNPEKSHREISIIDEKERQTLLNVWNQNNAPNIKEKTIHQLFEEQVEKTPNNIALSFNDQQLTYQQLYDKSQALALYLQSLGVKPESLVGLCVERSVDMVIGILAILQAGGAYVPLAPEFPEERLVYILKDSQLTLILTQKKFKKKLAVLISEYEKLVVLDEDSIHINKCIVNLKNKLLKEVQPHNLAYIIYTSGSTGKPKGVMTIHSNVRRIIQDTNYLAIDSKDSVISLSSYVFDGSIFDLFTPLSNGACLILPEEILDINSLEKIFNKNATVFMTTALFNSIVNNKVGLLNIPKTILFGGEKVSAHHVNKALECNSFSNLIHVYGPTETTVFATFHPIDSTSINSKIVNTIPIGKPIGDTQIYILDQDHKLQPVGVPGELYISGAGLSRGYLNRPELTKEKFIANPFIPCSLMYKSGDLARWLPDGNIEFIGRNDSQIKIRGYRIELGEIESILNEFVEIKQAIVIDREKNGTKSIVAYLVPATQSHEQVKNNQMSDVHSLRNERVLITKVREQLQTRLPAYMLPDSFTLLEVVPLTSNGKLDKYALPEPNFNSTDVYVAPRNPVEAQLADILKNILQIERIGTKDNFYHLGGNSISLILLLENINNELDTQLTVNKFLNQCTITSICQEISILNNKLNTEKLAAVD